MNLPKRDELGLRRVSALPKDSRMGFDDTTRSWMREGSPLPFVTCDRYLRGVSDEARARRCR